MTKDAVMGETGEEKKDQATSSAGEVLRRTRKDPKESFEPPPLFDVMCTYISYAVLVLFGYLADFWRRVGLKKDGGIAAAKDVSFKRS